MVCQRFVVSHRVHVRFIYLHLVNFHGKEIPYMDPVAIDMFFVANNHNHRTFQVPKMEVLTYIRWMDTAYVREVSPAPKIAGECRFVRKPSILGTCCSRGVKQLQHFPICDAGDGVLPSVLA